MISVMNTPDGLFKLTMCTNTLRLWLLGFLWSSKGSCKERFHMPHQDRYLCCSGHLYKASDISTPLYKLFHTTSHQSLGAVLRNTQIMCTHKHRKDSPKETESIQAEGKELDYLVLITMCLLISFSSTHTFTPSSSLLAGYGG